MRTLLSFFISYVSLSASQHHIWVFWLLLEMQEKLRTQILYNGMPKILGGFIHTDLTHCLRSWLSHWVVMATCHCYSWWRWWSDTLWVSLIRLWLHSLSCYLQIVVVGITLQFHRCVCECVYVWIFNQVPPTKCCLLYWCKLDWSHQQVYMVALLQLWKSLQLW
jgi:hypothetical protein